MAQSILKASRGTDQTNVFIQLAEQTADYAEMANCRLLLFSSPQLPYFSRLADEAKTKAIHDLRIFNEICAQVLSAGKSLDDSPAMTWYALKKLGFHFPSNLFEFITNDHVVEIYGRDNIQIFRNFKFFEVTSYPLEELLCRPWIELFVRENTEHSQAIVDIANKFYSKEITTVTPLGQVGTQKLIEQDSPFMYQVDAVVDFLSPIYEKDRFPAGFVAIETAKVATKIPEDKDAWDLLRDYYDRQIEI